MLKRGIALDYVFCNLSGEAYERAVVSVAKILADEWSFGYSPKFHVVDFVESVEELKRAVEPKYWQVVLKRLMYRVGEAIAQRGGREAVVTGEAVGQVSSQTLGNLRAIDEVATLPVFRPLLGYDKVEIIRLAERIGTAVLSAHIREYCAIVPDKPVTHAKPHAARDGESRMDLSVLDRAVTGHRVLDHYRAWHYPGAERRDLSDLAAHFRKLDKARTYVLYCTFGVQSAYVAEAMQREGYEAYSFKGGLRQLVQYARDRGLPVTV
jgi:thiamine biosynthesis protein ThiI